MREYSPRSVTVVVDGRHVVVLGADAPAAELARVVGEAMRDAREVSTAGTVTTASSAAEIRLCAMANGSAFDGLDALDARDYEPAFPAPPPPAPRHSARPVPVRRPPAAPRLVSWLVEGRGR